MASSDDISNWYTQYLGRSASPDEITGWTSGQYGGDPLNQIKNSGEAAQYTQSHPDASGSGVGGSPIGSSSAAGVGSSDIANWYQQYLGRAASPDEITGWTSGAYGGDPYNQIQQSGEAAQHRAALAAGLNSGGPAATAPAPAPNPRQAEADALDPDAARLRAGGWAEGDVVKNTPGSTMTSAPGNPLGQQGTWTKQADGSYIWHFDAGATPGLHVTNPGGNGPVAPTTPISPTTPKTTGGADDINSTDPMTRIKAALKAAGSDDDPNYWLGKITGDPNGMGSAWAYWLDRINRGDGAAAVKAGTMQRFNDGGGTPAPKTTTAPKATTPGGPGGGSPFQTAGNGNPFAFDPGQYFSGGAGGSSGMIDPSTQLYNQNLRLQLLSQLGILGTPTTDKSETIQPALSAYNNQSQRDEQTSRDAIAERYYASGQTGGSGLDSGSFNNAVIGNMEKGNEARSSYAGGLVYQDNLQRRQQLQAMMQTAVQAGQTDAAQQIEAAIATLNAKIAEQGLQQGFETSNNNLAYQYYNTDTNNTRALIEDGLNG